MRPTEEWLAQPGGLAERLQQMRKASGLTGEKLAQQAGWPRSKIPKLENGRQMPSKQDIEAWARACGQPDAVPDLLDMLGEAQTVHRQYRLRRGHATIQEEFNGVVREAKRVRNFEVTQVPGLLQTPDYARCRALEAVRVYGFPEDGVDTAVAARMRRQDVLYESGRRFEFVITEAVLRFRLCPPQTMLGQIDRLAKLAALENITVGIIPLDTELSVSPLHGFLIADDSVYLETHASLVDVHGSEAAGYEGVANALMAEASTGEEARAILASAAEKLTLRHANL